jgi:hypothetical protein
MKRVILCACALLLVMGITTAQTEQKKITGKNQLKKKNSIKKEIRKQAPTRTNKNQIDTVFSLSSTGSYNALEERQSVARLQIADPIVKALKAKANGADIKIGSSGLVGVPKGTYGFANGKIAFYLGGATSNGTSTGSGSVGTGSSPGNIGSLGPAMGVNGKSPYAGNGAYGTRVPLIVERVPGWDSIFMKRRN